MTCFFKAFALTGRQVCVRNNPGRCPGLGATALSGRIGAYMRKLSNNASPWIFPDILSWRSVPFHGTLCCILLFTLQQDCSRRSVVHDCIGCMSCFPLYAGRLSTSCCLFFPFIVKNRKMSPECFGIQGFFVFLHRGYAFCLLAHANLVPSKDREAGGDIIKKVEI